MVATTLQDCYEDGGDFEWGSPPLQRELPDIHLSDLQIEPQYMKHLAPDLVQVNGMATMHGTYDGQDSGRYWTSDIWYGVMVGRGGSWESG